jgi:carbon monoxide dehydrogenase subunit G
MILRRLRSRPGGAVYTSRASIHIARPIDEVFTFVADARNRPQWDEGVDSEELTSPEPIGVGSTIRTKMRSMGREYQYTWEIVEHQPPSRMKVESTSGPFPTTLVFDFESEDGGTRVDAAVTGKPGGLMRLFQGKIARTTQANLDQAYPRLKRLLETGSAT